MLHCDINYLPSAARVYLMTVQEFDSALVIPISSWFSDVSFWALPLSVAFFRVTIFKSVQHWEFRNKFRTAQCRNI